MYKKKKQGRERERNLQSIKNGKDTVIKNKQASRKMRCKGATTHSQTAAQPRTTNDDEKKDWCRQGKRHWPLLPLSEALGGARCWTLCGRAHSSWCWKMTTTSPSSSCAPCPGFLCSRRGTADPHCCPLHGKYGKWDHHWRQNKIRIMFLDNYRRNYILPFQSEHVTLWCKAQYSHDHKLHTDHCVVKVYINVLYLQQF